MPSDQDIADQRSLLDAHRETLTILLRQKALAGPIHTPPPVEHGIAYARNEIRRIKTTLRDWGEMVADSPEDNEGAAPLKQSQLRLMVHHAVFKHNALECYFINATNLADREIEVTHVWFECDPPIHVLQPARPLPKRLKPHETWETWIEVYKLPVAVMRDPYHLARARLSTGEIVAGQKNDHVPSSGYVPGGPTRHD